MRNLVGIAPVLSLYFAALMIDPASAASSDHSANYHLASCRDFVNRQFATAPFLQGECVGTIEGLATFANLLPFQTSQSCMPEDVTVVQMTTVVVRWIDERPRRWNEDFRALVLYALHDA